MNGMTCEPFLKPEAASDRKVVASVLIVDDDVGVRKFVAKVLDSSGYRIDAAEGVDAAILHFESKKYDVVLVDLEMPHRNGMELLDRMMQDEIDSVPILLTGTQDVRIAVAAMKRGAFDYISKPIDPASLRWAIGRGIDVALARRRECTLKRIASEWEATFDACPDLLIVLDGEGRILRLNRAAAGRIYTEAKELIGRSFREAFPGELGAAIADCRVRLQAGEPAAEANIVDASLGGHFAVSLNPLPSSDGHSAEAVVLARDVTERVQAEHARMRLVRQLLVAQEDERRRIAKELHDGVCQSMVSLSVGLAALSHEPNTAPIRNRLERLGSFATETLEDIRRLSHGLRPAVLDEMGLAAALSRLAESFTNVHGIRAELVSEIDPADRLPMALESTAYRIVQEALANVAKHSRAETVDIVVELCDRSLRISVADDGVGFETASFPGSNFGFGLTGMWERASMLGGTFQIESSPDVGTTIDVRIPLAEDRT